MERWDEEHKLLHAKPSELGLAHDKPVYILASSRCSNHGGSSKATIPILAMPSITKNSFNLYHKAKTFPRKKSKKKLKYIKYFFTRE